MAVKPDLIVLTPNRGSKFTYEKLKQINIETLVVPLYGLQDLFDAYKILGEKTGAVESAGKLIRELSDAVEDAKKKAPSGKSLKIVFVNWQNPLVIAGQGSLENDLIEMAGARNVADKSGDRYPHWQIEGLFEYDPDIIIDASRHGRDMTLENQREGVQRFWRQYSTLRALRNGNLFMFRENVYSVAGPRTTRLVRALTAIVNEFGTKTQSEYYERVGI
jgi:iron complex transport system substrate-binding protein